MKPKIFQKRTMDNQPTKALLAAAQMPPLKHNNDPYDVTKSGPVRWLQQQPDILEALFQYYKDRGAIVFDKETGTWKGVNHGRQS